MGKLQDEIAAFCEAHKMKPSRFGRECMNDASFVSRMTPETRFLAATETKVRKFMRQYATQNKGK